MIPQLRQILSRPLVPVTCFFGVGIYLGSDNHLTPLLTSIVFGLLTALIPAFLDRGKIGTAVLALLLSAFVAGYLRISIDYQEGRHDDEFIATLTSAEAEILLIGTLAETAEDDDNERCRITLDSIQLKAFNEPADRPIHRRFLLTLLGTLPGTILPGDTVAIRCRLRTVPQANTPGGASYSDYLFRNHISAIGTITSPVFIHPVTDTSSRIRLSLGSHIERYRLAAATFLSETLPPDTAGLYRALLLGDRSAVIPETMEAFRAAGVAHILAVSGMHVGLLSLFLYSSWYWLIRRSTRLLLLLNARKCALLLSIPLLLFYACLAGLQPPVVRALIMTLFFAAAVTLDRIKSPLTTLAGAAFTIIAYDPRSLSDPSFQLSFAAVAAIILIVPPMYQSFQNSSNGSRRIDSHRPIKWILTIVVVSLAATIGTMPLTILHFNRISTVTVIANVIIEPLICLWGMVFGFLALPLIPLAPTSAGMLLKIGALAIDTASATAAFFSALPHATVWLPSPSLWSVTIYYLSLAVIFTVSLRSVKYLFISILIASCALFFSPLLSLTACFRSADRISILDVGHGSSAVAEFADGRTVLFDAGCRSSPGFDCGASIIAPYLWQSDITVIDDIIVSHADADHTNGLPSLFKRFTVKRLWLPYGNIDKSHYRDMLAAATANGIRIIYPDGGVFIESDSYRLTALGNATGKPAFHQWVDFPAASEDDNGLVVLLELPNFAVLFPGDISVRRERQLLDSGWAVTADILLAAHHGSATSNSAAFLDAVNPDWIVVSKAGSSNSMRLAPSICTFCGQAGARLLSTAANGTIAIITTRTDHSISAYSGGVWKTIDSRQNGRSRLRPR